MNSYSESSGLTKPAGAHPSESVDTPSSLLEDDLFDSRECEALAIIDGALRGVAELAARAVKDALAVPHTGLLLSREQLRAARLDPPTIGSSPDLSAAIFAIEAIRRLARAPLPRAAEDQLGDARAAFAQRRLPEVLAPIRWLETLLMSESMDCWAYLEHIDASAWERQTDLNRARPLAELVRCWWEGYARAEVPAVDAREMVPTWSDFLTRSAGVLRVIAVDSSRRLKMAAPNTLLQWFDQVCGDDGLAELFATPVGRLPRPTRGRRRRDRPAPDFDDVAVWVCDGRSGPHPALKDRCFTSADSPIAHSARRYRPRPPSGTETWPDLEDQLDLVCESSALQLPTRATRWDRRVCPDYHNCGGVLVPASAAWLNTLTGMMSADGELGESAQLLITWDQRKMADLPPDLLSWPTATGSP